MSTSTQLRAQGRELAKKQLDLVNDNSRPWSDRKSEFDKLEQDIKAVTDQLETLNGINGADLHAAGATSWNPGRKDGTSLLGTATKSRWAADAARRIAAVTGPYGVKALMTGSVTVPSPITSSVTGLPTVPANVLDLITNRLPVDEGNDFGYLRQTVRTGAAAPVADNATKPTSTYTFVEETDRVRVFAHLGEPFPERFVNDYEELSRILQAEMVEDLARAVETDVLSGDGTGEHFTGLSITDGVRTQEYATDALTTLRKAGTTLVAAGEMPSAWVLNYADLEALDLTREDGTTGGFLAEVDQRVFGGLPKVGTTAVPAGTAWLGDWSQLRLYVREGAKVDADKSGDLFEKNQLRLRVECRLGSAVLRPSAFVKIDLTSA